MRMAKYTANTFALCRKLSRMLCAHSAYNFPRDPFDLYHLKSQRSLDTQSIIFILSVVVRRRRHLAFPLGSESSSDGANAMPILVRLIVQFSSLPFFFPLFISSTYSSSSSTHLNVTSRSARFHLSFVRSFDDFFLMNANFLLFQETQTGTSDVTFFFLPGLRCVLYYVATSSLFPNDDRNVINQNFFFFLLL